MLKRNYKERLLEDYHNNFNIFNMENFPIFSYPKDYRNYDLIIGHFPFAKYEHLKNEGWKFITWLREPVERFISHYNYDVTNKIIKKKFGYYEGYPINKYINERGKNITSIMLGKNLKMYDFVGFQDRMEESVLRLNKFLKGELKDINLNFLNRLNSKNIKISYKDLNLIKKSCHKDIVIYNWFKKNLNGLN